MSPLNEVVFRTHFAARRARNPGMEEIDRQSLEKFTLIELGAPACGR
jgi:hypothetical protein